MTIGMRWRIITLQAVLVLVLAFITGFLFWANSFTTGMVREQLIAQQIYFPDKSQAVTGRSLDPAVFPELQQYAGQQVDTGDKAKAYADGFIGRHLRNVAGGKTYSQVSAAASADPTNTKLTAQKATLFQGETLRGLLLQAYAWWTIGVYAGYAAIGLALATIAVFGALVFELLAAVRRPKKVEVLKAIAA